MKRTRDSWHPLQQGLEYLIAAAAPWAHLSGSWGSAKRLLRLSWTAEAWRGLWLPVCARCASRSAMRACTARALRPRVTALAGCGCAQPHQPTLSVAEVRRLHQVGLGGRGPAARGLALHRGRGATAMRKQRAASALGARARAGLRRPVLPLPAHRARPMDQPLSHGAHTAACQPRDSDLGHTAAQKRGIQSGKWCTNRKALRDGSDKQVRCAVQRAGSREGSGRHGRASQRQPVRFAATLWHHPCISPQALSRSLCSAPQAPRRSSSPVHSTLYS